MNPFDQIYKLKNHFSKKNEEIRLAIGRQEARALRSINYSDIKDAEFQVFSQWGEDGIIQYLIQRVPIKNDVFIEFGVENYRESNTRFLLQNNNWSGLILDGGKEHLSFNSEWRYDIRAVSAFITAENINTLISKAGIEGDIGLLSIDLDGNDYWIFKSINVVSPRILVMEYNSVFGPDHMVTIPYQDNFHRTNAHFSNIYWGASLSALDNLATSRGYRLIGTNSAGNNAFFLRNDVLGSFKALSVKEAYTKSKYRESRDESGNLTFIADHAQRLKLIEKLPVYDLKQEKIVLLSDL